MKCTYVWHLKQLEQSCRLHPEIPRQYQDHGTCRLHGRLLDGRNVHHGHCLDQYRHLRPMRDIGMVVDREPRLAAES